MARQSGPFYITGTYNDICFYKMDGEYYARRKSSLSGKRVKKDKAFARTMMYAGIMGQASALAAEVYRRLPKERKQHALYRQLVGKANGFLKHGEKEEEVKMKLEMECGLVERSEKDVAADKSIHIVAAEQRTANQEVNCAVANVEITRQALQPAADYNNTTKTKNISSKTMRITGNRQRKRPLLRNRNGRLYVSTQGLISSIDERGRVVIMPPTTFPTIRPAACGDS